MKHIFIIILFSLLFSCSSGKKVISVNEQNLILSINYNELTSLFDYNPITISIENIGKEQVTIQDIRVLGDIGLFRNENIKSSHKRFFYYTKPDVTILDKEYKFSENFQLKILEEISNLYIPNIEKSKYQYRNEKIIDNSSFLNLSVEINYNRSENLTKNIAIPIKLTSIKNWSQSELFFNNQYDKYHDKWYASSYIASLINNKNILKNLN
ncbi:hypothetical protein [Aquimarina algiphila]|uniref:hypothetical protein n=1 Tax=Aquimarina algiphila TaxID=2047982 RepID=UPI00232C6162|nr:hypothetical protein [Aquimarina algiphila]